MATRSEGNTISVYAGKDFIGYETDYYAVRPMNNSGVKIVLRGVKAVVQEKKSERTTPALRLFNFPPNLKFVRIVYLVRESKSDHDMVLLAAVAVVQVIDEPNVRSGSCWNRAGSGEENAGRRPHSMDTSQVILSTGEHPTPAVPEVHQLMSASRCFASHLK
jgi:hypothetical protein